MYPRKIRPSIVEALEDTRIVMVLGARQVGKSTLTREIAASEHPADVFSLDNLTTRQAAAADPTGFVAEMSRPALIDEVQRVPDLLLEIKESVDKDPRFGQFLLTGSANVLQIKKVADALTGRVEIVELWPFSQAEIEGSSSNLVDALFAATPPSITATSTGRDAWVDRVARGGYPEARLRKGRRREKWFENYLRTTIERDLRDISEAHKLEEMPRLLRLLGSQAANAFNSLNISRSIALDHKTVKSYVKLLETVYLVKQLPAWRPGLGSRETATPKVYVVDSGLLAYLLNADERRIATDPQVSGKILENFVAMEIVRLATWSDMSCTPYHYRDDRDEVDLVLEARSGQIGAVEVKAAASVKERDYRPLAKLRDRQGKDFTAGFVLYSGAATIPLGDRLWAVPIEGLWSP